MGVASRQHQSVGYGEKLAVRVITVDKAKNRVECATRDGAMIWAAVWETPTVFRWPEIGEVWTVRKDTNIWRLDQIVQTALTEEQSGTTPKTLEELPEGDTRILGETIHINNLSVNGSITNSEGWQTPTLQGSWSNFGVSYQGVSFRKAPDDFVWIRGAVQNPNEVSTGMSIFVLPEEYRPKASLVFPQWASLNTGALLTAVRVDVQFTGGIVVQTSATKFDLLSLNCGFYVES